MVLYIVLYILYTENNRIKRCCMMFLSKRQYFIVNFSSSCIHIDSKCSQNSQMNYTTVMQWKKEGDWESGIVKLCLSEWVFWLLTSAVASLCLRIIVKVDYSQMAIRVIILLILSVLLLKDMFFVWLPVQRMTSSVDTHVTLAHRNSHDWYKRQAFKITLSRLTAASYVFVWLTVNIYEPHRIHTIWTGLINTLPAAPTWASAPAMGNQNGQHANRYEDGKQLKRK